MDMYQKREMRKNKKMDENAKSLPSTSINWYPGHMAKTKREIKEALPLIDIVYELIDARVPISSKNKDIDELIKNKPRILIMTKTDLCDIDKTNSFKHYYESLGYKTVLVDLKNGKNIKDLFAVTAELSNEINKKRQNNGLKPRKMRVLILGIPNVGKSTLINRLVKKNVVKTGNIPGVTRNLNWIRINNDLELLDSPGILWPKLDNDEVALNLASTTAIKEEILDIEEISIYIINKMKKHYYDNLMKRYKLNNTINVDDIIVEIGQSIGAIKNNEIDYNRVYHTIINDLREGNLGRITFDEL